MVGITRSKVIVCFAGDLLICQLFGLTNPHEAGAGWLILLVPFFGPSHPARSENGPWEPRQAAERGARSDAVQSRQSLPEHLGGDQRMDARSVEVFCRRRGR